MYAVKITITKPKGIMAKKKLNAKEDARVAKRPRRMVHPKKNKISQSDTPPEPGSVIRRERWISLLI